MQLSSISLALTRAGVLTFSPSALFANGEQGWVYDPSNLSTLFQDAAGTTPVTAMEQPVGLQLDLSGRGNHRRQTTSANRPVVSARVNLLTKTEQFDDAAWVKSSVTATANSVIAPDGTLTADKIEASSSGNYRECGEAVALQANVPYLMRFSIEQGSTSWVYVTATDRSANAHGFYFNTATGAVGSEYTKVGTTITASNPSITLQANGFYAIVVTLTSTVDKSYYATVGVVDANASPTVTSGKNIYLWGADLRPANQGVGLPAYQRVNTSTDYDTAGFPVYIKPNGSNQFMVTNSINFSATDKMTVWQGVRKLSDAAFQSIAELSATADTNNGSFCVGASTLNGDGLRRTWASVATGTINTLAGVGVYAQPDTKVVTTIYNLALATAAEENVMRLNGVAQTLAISGASAGTGNFGNYPAYFYMRGGASNPFSGHDYGSICRGAESSAAQITAAEAWINSKTKAY